jgi:hypothetical protein
MENTYHARYWNGPNTSPKPRLEFGYDVAVPNGTKAAWGARAIFAMPHYGCKAFMDLLYDRQGTCYLDGHKDAVQTLTGLLNKGALATAQARFNTLVQAGEVHTRECGEVVLYDDDTIKMVGNSNGSHGYFYVAAWLK